MAVCLLAAIASGLSAQGYSVKFYSVNNANAYLSDPIGTNTAMTIKYVEGDVKPLYLIMSSLSMKKEIDYTSARFLVNLKEENEASSRLTFVDGKLYNDGSLVLQGVKGDSESSSALFSFRLADKGNKDGDFLIESWSNENGEGEWIKIQNGAPCLVKTTLSLALNNEADIFNVEQNFPDMAGDGIYPVASSFSISVDYGVIIIKGAEGKNALVTDMFGQPITQKLLGADEISLSVPSGIAFVSIDNQPAVKVLVK